MNDDLELALQVLHEIIAEELLNRLRSGKATEAEISQAINLLKHNGLTMALYSDCKMLHPLRKLNSIFTLKQYT